METEIETVTNWAIVMGCNSEKKMVIVMGLTMDLEILTEISWGKVMAKKKNSMTAKHSGLGSDLETRLDLKTEIMKDLMKD